MNRVDRSIQGGQPTPSGGEMLEEKREESGRSPDRGGVESCSASNRRREHRPVYLDAGALLQERYFDNEL